MYWHYANDHRRSPYPNGFNNVGQYPYWRHSPYPTGDQMLMQRGQSLTKRHRQPKLISKKKLAWASCDKNVETDVSVKFCKLDFSLKL
jgi:hypothetical protein